jgi:CubicO group peptidase (beta-lactamase class C family)
MADQGIVTFDQPAYSVIPRFAHLPKGITLQQLATHTSGLPHLPRNIIVSFLKNRRNPYANYTEREFAAYMRKCSVNTHYVGTIHYSNLGMGLLGYLLTEITNRSYDAALREEICHPLGLHETFSRRAFHNNAHLAQPHDGSGMPTSHWDFHRPFEGAALCAKME